MMPPHEQKKLWTVGLTVAVWLFVNVFMQSYFFKRRHHHIEQQSYSYNKTSIKNTEIDKQIDLEVISDEPAVETDIKPSLNLNLKLLGTIVGSLPIAFISDLDSQVSRLYRLNEVVAGARIVSIKPGRVILMKDGLIQELVFISSNKESGEDKGTDIIAISPQQIIVSKSAVLEQMDNVNELLAKIKVSAVPDKSSDKLKGFRIDNVPSESMIEKAGIKSKDIICSIEGKKFENIQEALKIFGEVRGRSNIEVDLLRDGEPVTLSYEIRN